MAVKSDLDEAVTMMQRVSELCFDRAVRISGKKNTEIIESFTHRQAKALFIVGFRMEARPEGIHLKDFAAAMDITLATASVLVETMVRKNFFDRTRSAKDRRSVLIRLSKAGERVFGTVQRHRTEIHQGLFVGVSDRERAVFSKVIRHLLDQLLQEET